MPHAELSELTDQEAVARFESWYATIDERVAGFLSEMFPGDTPAELALTLDLFAEGMRRLQTVASFGATEDGVALPEWAAPGGSEQSADLPTTWRLDGLIALRTVALLREWPGSMPAVYQNPTLRSRDGHHNLWVVRGHHEQVLITMVGVRPDRDPDEPDQIVQRDRNTIRFDRDLKAGRARLR